MNIDTEILKLRMENEFKDKDEFLYYIDKRRRALAILKMRMDDYKSGEYHHPDKIETMKERFSTRHESDSATADN